MMGGGDASAVSHADTGPAREPRDLSEGHDWTRQGTDGFLGHTACQGQTGGSSASRHGLDPDGCVVRHHVADTKSTKTGMRPAATRRGVKYAEQSATAKKLANVVQGGRFAS